MKKTLKIGSNFLLFSSVQFSRSVVSDSLQPHESQHTRPPCPSPTPGVHSDSHFVLMFKLSQLWPIGASSSLILSSFDMDLGVFVSLLSDRINILGFSCMFHDPRWNHPFLVLQFSSVAQLCLTLCDPMNHSTPGLPVHHQLPEFTQTHVHRVGDAIQPFHLLSSPSPPAPNPSQHQSLFQ